MRFSFPPLTSDVSLNRVRIVDVPGLPDSLRGSTGYSLLARNEFIKEILKIFPKFAWASDPLQAWDEQELATNNPLAVYLAEEFGNRLGWLLLTIKLGTPASRVARPEWNNTRWEFWANVGQIILGGGLVSGHLGVHMARVAQHMIGDSPTLKIAANPRVLPLIGASRCALPATHMQIVLDAGQTSIKRGIAHYQAGKLATLQLLPVRPTPQNPTGEVLLEALVGAIGETCQEASLLTPNLSRQIVVSVASYVDEYGQPAHDATFGTLYHLRDDIPQLLADEVCSRLDTTEAIQVTLLHDGTAGALPFAGTPRCAVIIMGTALGIGVPPESDNLFPISPDFVVSS